MRCLYVLRTFDDYESAGDFAGISPGTQIPANERSHPFCVSRRQREALSEHPIARATFALPVSRVCWLEGASAECSVLRVFPEACTAC